MSCPDFVYQLEACFAYKLCKELLPFNEDLTNWGELEYLAFTTIVKTKFNEYFNHNNYYVNHVVINSNRTTCAGQAGKVYGEDNSYKISLSKLIHKTKTDLLDTTLHELAHIIVFHKYPRKPGENNNVKPHGVEWKTACYEMGYTNLKRTHDMDVSETKRKKTIIRHYYKCNCEAPCAISTVVHNKLQKGTNSYFCRGCSTKLYKDAYFGSQKVQ